MAKKETKEKVKKEKKVEKSNVEEVTVDQAYLDAHPELVEEGVAVGDVIEVPVVPTKTAKGLDLDGEVAVLKGAEFIRVYPEGSEEAVKSFLSKDGNYVAVDASEVVSITVGWREDEMTKESGTGRTVSTGKILSRERVFSPADGDGWMKDARNFANSAPKRSCIARLG